MPGAVDVTKLKSGKWTIEEHNKYVEGLVKFGKDFRAIAEYIGTRNSSQVRTHHTNETKKSPDETPRKRKNEGEESTATPKKVKSDTPKAKSSTASKKMSNSASKTSSTRVAQQKVVHTNITLPTNSADTQGKDILPPAPMPKQVKTPEVSKKPVKTQPVTKHTPSISLVEPKLEPGEKETLGSLLKTEEVQTVAAGVIGFLLVLAVKKIIG